MSKRKVLSVSDKVEIVRELERGEKNVAICRKYGLSSSTVSTLWKNKEVLKKAFESNITGSKRLKKCEKADLDEALLRWFTAQRNAGLAISGPILKIQAQKFAVEFGYPEFSCSNGWLDRFKNRHNICYGKINGEAVSVDAEVTSKWLLDVWPDHRRGYSDDDIYNADETGLFFNLTPDKTLKFKGEKCVGGKLLKNRLTVLICANMSGSDKKKLLVIGKSAKPRCFKNIQRLPVDYVSNKKAWMTSDIFANFVFKWDSELRKKHRQILLLVDNCPAHPCVQNLTNIKLVFLPPNSTSVLQPMDQGVIRSFKCHFRRQLILMLLERMEKTLDKKITVLDAIRLMSDAWDYVSSACIQNCFGKAKLQSITSSDDEDDNLSLSEWLRRENINHFNHVPDIDDFIDVDEGVVTFGIPSPEDIVAEIKSPESNVESEEEDTTAPTFSYQKLMENAEYLQCFFETEGNGSDEVFNAMSTIRRVLREGKQKARKQTTLDAFVNVLP